MIANAHRDASPEGEQRKAAAFSLLDMRRNVYINRGRRASLTSLLETETATIDAVRGAVELPEGMNPVCFGVVPGALARAGIISADGFAKSRRAESHGRPVQCWRLVDPVAARRWLRDHPAQPDPLPPQSDPMLFDLAVNEKPPGATGGSEERNLTNGTQIPQRDSTRN